VAAAEPSAPVRTLQGLSRWPLAVSPMAGGPSTAELVIAVAAAGAFGFLAGGYKTARALADEMSAVRSAGVGSFGVNVFVPGRPAADPAELAAYVASLAAEADALGATLGAPAWDDDAYVEKLGVLLADPPALVSFTFGCPDEEVVRSLQTAGALVAVTITTPEEAAVALRAGVDSLCLQGAEAGAHRGSFANDDRPDQDRPVRALLAAVRRRTLVPLIAAGGVAGPDDVVALRAAGAAMVQAGTAFLRCPESGAHPVYKQALAEARSAGTDGAGAGGPVSARCSAGLGGATGVTRAYSGRRARCIVNEMMRAHTGAPAAYPEINNATRPLRAAAAAVGDSGHMSIYAGTGFRAAEAVPAEQVVARLVSGLARRGGVAARVAP
jgi:nitronate monooxygenase